MASKQKHYPKNRNRDDAASKLRLNRVVNLAAEKTKIPPLKVRFNNQLFEVSGTPTVGYTRELNRLKQKYPDGIEDEQAQEFFTAFSQYQIPPKLAKLLEYEPVETLATLVNAWAEHVKDTSGLDVGE